MKPGSMYAAIGPDGLIYGIGETWAEALKDAIFWFSSVGQTQKGDQPTLRIVDLSRWNQRIKG
jgi:hypothetical protein